MPQNVVAPAVSKPAAASPVRQQVPLIQSLPVVSSPTRGGPVSVGNVRPIATNIQILTDQGTPIKLSPFAFRQLTAPVGAVSSGPRVVSSIPSSSIKPQFVKVVPQAPSSSSAGGQVAYLTVPISSPQRVTLLPVTPAGSAPTVRFISAPISIASTAVRSTTPAPAPVVTARSLPPGSLLVPRPTLAPTRLVSCPQKKARVHVVDLATSSEDDETAPATVPSVGPARAPARATTVAPARAPARAHCSPR
ncbi:unnamed protein product [Cyprideis torosa]|uniref:Uncharacterized protein n=1 Tax=Cyprideis torosa TaxID=163714 RepID=A0A7R8WNL1_9CRUS|nr:unnamed protein product [Cyprideis torosa]CAG0900355.1 unnamed protein product [Cyprideis torosa]